MQLVILITLTLMILSDYRNRTVVLWQLMLFGITMLLMSLLENGLWKTFMNLTANILISLLIGLAVYVYFLLKYKTVQSVIGKGDLLFILFLTPFFALRDFLTFMLVSFVGTLLMWGIVTSIRRDNGHIPLISGIGLCLCVLLIYQQLI